MARGAGMPRELKNGVELEISNDKEGGVETK